ncbi:MAG TPA: Gfo/Idh/MocA family oxidoreductase [Chthonomonadaceae bacterium]|nr:Gfo/Idh/MocA family oxidoreductase [Chthonomonadaceae bacterium]
MIRIGLVDFDTSHVVAFTQRLNHIGVAETEWVDGAKVVAGCPGESEMMPERIPGYAETLKGYGIELVERPEQLIGKIDAVMIESQQGSKHLWRARPFLEAGMPVFVDKPFAETVADAETMIRLAEKHASPLMSCSALRYDPLVTQAIARTAELGKILSADTWTAAALHPGNPGLLHYGIHGAELLFALMGVGCKSVQFMGGDRGEVNAGLWESGHAGTVRGIRDGKYSFGAVIHYEKGNAVIQIEGAAFYREMLRAFIRMCETDQPPIPYAETREIIAFCSAAVTSRESGGLPTAL